MSAYTNMQSLDIFHTPQRQIDWPTSSLKKVKESSDSPEVNPLVCLEEFSEIVTLEKGSFGGSNPAISEIKDTYEEICNKDVGKDETDGKQSFHRTKSNSSRKGEEAEASLPSKKTRYQWKSSLSHHVRIHSNERAYKCRVCDLVFKQDTVRKKHELRHLKEGRNNRNQKKGKEKLAVTLRAFEMALMLANVSLSLVFPSTNNAIHRCRKWVDFCQNPDVHEKFLGGSFASMTILIFLTLSIPGQSPFSVLSGLLDMHAPDFSEVISSVHLERVEDTSGNISLEKGTSVILKRISDNKDTSEKIFEESGVKGKKSISIIKSKRKEKEEELEISDSEAPLQSKKKDFICELCNKSFQWKGNMVRHAGETQQALISTELSVVI
ncbi:hypothetical protein J437_LFUL014631 [Ladona fulva]|uniref:C2H2-type domain-containing protein n=1 Tax=Ladona fulva TaxID=123851 RepID=A0A8K0P5L3_LADFU|nr:hypothetical protein J437_LFUL014631 [Ladona fulva]